MPWSTGEDRRVLASGAWSLQVVGASLDHVTFEGAEVLRAIRVIVRDRDWRTVPAVLDEVVLGDVVPDSGVPDSGLPDSGLLNAGSDRLVAVLRGHHDELGARTSWSATLRLEAGTLSVDLDLVAANTFLRNRIGLVILHPTALAGAALAVEHPGGAVTRTTFPTEIAPHQPAVDIASLSWEKDGLRVSMRLEGDVFEMEDQRNWTDASFKTYSTPLSLPFPVTVQGGDRVQQSLRVDVSGHATEAPIVDGLTPATARLPRVAVGASTAPGSSTSPPAWTNGLDQLVELDLRDPGWTRALARARNDLRGAALDVRLITDSPERLDSALAALCGVPVTRIGVFDAATHGTTAPLWERLREGVRREPVLGTLVGGTRAHFTELNRTHDSLPGDLPELTFSITPQMHDVSTDQVVESLGMQRLVALQGGRIAAGRPVHVGPVTLRARFNAVATSDTLTPAPHLVDTGYGPEFVWGSTDERQHSDEYAAWLLASYVALAVDGVASVTFAEAWGPRGFGSAGGRPDPAAGVLGWLADVAGLPPVELGEVPAHVAALAARVGGIVVILLANVSEAPATVTALGVTRRLEAFEVARVEARPEDR